MKNTEKVLYYCERKWQTREDRAEAVPVRVQKLDKISRRNHEGKSMKL